MSDNRECTDNAFREWRDAVDEQLLDVYAITIEDSGLDDLYLSSHWRSRESPSEFIEWFGAKYDLAPLAEFKAGVSG